MEGDPFRWLLLDKEPVLTFPIWNSPRKGNVISTFGERGLSTPSFDADRQLPAFKGERSLLIVPFSRSVQAALLRSARSKLAQSCS